MYTTRTSQNWLPEIFNSVFDNTFVPAAHYTSPAVNIVEKDSAYMLEVAAPGKTKEDFNLSLENEQLVISMEKKVEENSDNSHYLRREFNYSNFKQAYYLPDDVNVENISAQMCNGILIVTLPKKQECLERKKNRTIAIE